MDSVFVDKEGYKMQLFIVKAKADNTVVTYASNLETARTAGETAFLNRPLAWYIEVVNMDKKYEASRSRTMLSYDTYIDGNFVPAFEPF